MRNLFIILMSMAVLLGMFVSSSVALPIYGDKTTGATEEVGSFSGELTYNPISDTSASLTVELTNTSPDDNGGFITGFALNNPDNLITSITEVIFSDSSFHLIGDPSSDNSIKAPPFGSFDIGASLGKSNDLTGTGGRPRRGIEVGATKTFTFRLQGSDLSGLSEQSFVNELPYDSTDPYFFTVRFKGFEDDNSDKVLGIPYDSAFAIPEPTTILLLGISLIGLAWIGRKFKRH